MDITNPNIRDYLASVMLERTEAFQSLHDYAVAYNVPIIKHEMEQFLRFIVAMKKPKKILEVGTAIGYSGILMLNSYSEAHLTTLEISQKMIEQANKNFSEFGVGHQVTLIEGDGTETIQSLDGQYDLIFIDAAKGQYLNYYREAMRLLAPDGILIADNILQNGFLAKSRFAIPRRQRTIHGRMRKFVREVMENPLLTTSVLPIADGATISYRHTEEKR